MKRERLVVLVGSIAIFALALAGPALCQVPGQTFTAKDKTEMANEQKAGAEAAAEVAKEVHLSTDKSMIARVNTIGQKLAALADTTIIPASFGNDKVYKFNYTFHVVDDPDVNAFSLPGGYIYVNSGLLALVRSDDELAGVLGHEITHAAHHHAFQEEHDDRTIQAAGLLAMIAAVLAESSQSVNPVTGEQNNSNGGLGVAVAAQYGVAGWMAHHNIGAERDADHGGLILMSKAGYNPEAMVTFMQLLEDVERRSPVLEMGIMRDHPLTPERIAAAQAGVAALGVAVTPQLIAEATEVDKFVSTPAAGGVSVIALGTHTCATLSDPDGSRARAAIALLNQDLGQGLEIREIAASQNMVTINDQPVLTVTGADAALAPGATPETIAGDIAHSLQTAVYAESFAKLPPDSPRHDQTGGGAGAPAGPQ
jgi:hypothetical protein